MNRDKHINYVEFPACDLEKTQIFFEQVFGWSFQSWGDEYCSFSNAGIEGGFFLSDMKSDSDSGAALVVLFSTDLESAQALVENAGGTIVKPIFSFPGGRRFHFREPSGNELAVWSDS